MKRLITILFISAAFGATAQNQTIDPTVEVNRDYQGKMLETAKSKLSTAAADSLSRFNLNFNYSFFDKPYKDMYEFSAVPSASMPKEAPAARPSFVAKAGIGYPLAPEAAIWYSPELKGNNYLDLNGNFNLFNGEVPLISLIGETAGKTGNKSKNKEYSYGIEGMYTHAWRSGELDVYGKFNGGYNTYYNTGSSIEADSESHRFNMVEGGIGAKSSGAGKYGKKLNWNVGGVFRHTNDTKASTLHENYFRFKGEAGPTFGRYNKFMVGVGVEMVQYKGDPASFRPDFYMGIFGIKPQYRYENGNLKINIGLELQGKSSNAQSVNEGHSYVFPAVDLQLMLVPEKLWLYATADGWNNLNTYSSMLEENRWLNPDNIKGHIDESSVPLHIEGGFNGRFTDKFSWRAYAGYAIHKSMLQYRYSDNCLYPTFSDHRQFMAGGKLSVTAERFKGEASAQYSSYSGAMVGKIETEMPALGRPELEGDIKLSYNWSSRFYTQVQCHMQGKYAIVHNSFICTVPGFANLGATAGYAHSPALTFWLRGNNLLNSATQYLPFYTGRGIGISGGIIVKL